MAKKDKEGRVFYVTHSGELLAWLLVLLVFVAIFSIGFIKKEHTRDDDYRIFLQDVDGLIVGSPVRMMGVEVGHVVKLKPMKDEVYVKFILTDKGVYIPQGTVATVEFSGMAGSKSLELYLPDEGEYIDNSVPLLRADPPKRLHDALRMLNEMYQKIGSIINTASSFGNKLDLGIEKSSETNVNVTEFLDYSNKYIDDTIEKTEEFKKSLRGINKNVK